MYTRNYDHWMDTLGLLRESREEKWNRRISNMLCAIGMSAFPIGCMLWAAGVI